MLRLILASLLACSTLNAATVTGTLKKATGAARDGRVTFTPLDTPYSDGTATYHWEPITVRTTAGAYTVSLVQGQYRVAVDGIVWRHICVPSGTATLSVDAGDVDCDGSGIYFQGGVPTNALPGFLPEWSVLDPDTFGSGDVTLEQLNTASNAVLTASANADNLTSGTVPDARIPSTIARDTEVSAAVSAHEAAGDPHSTYTSAAEAAAAAPVQSVASKTGAVTLVKGDVGLANVDNTADVDKPVSTATQAALDAKQALLTAESDIAIGSMLGGEIVLEDATPGDMLTVNSTGKVVSVSAPTFTGPVTMSSLSVASVIFTNPPAPPSLTVATLPTSSLSSGAVAWVTDAIIPDRVGWRYIWDGSAWVADGYPLIAATTDVPTLLRYCLRSGWTGTKPRMWGRMGNFPLQSSNPEGLAISSVGTGAGIVSLQYSTPEVPGGFGIATGTTPTGSAMSRGPSILFKAGQYYIESCRFALNSGLPDGTENYWAFLGVSNGTVGTIGSQANGIYYDKYNALGYGASAADNWQLLTRSNSVNTITDTGIAANTGWHTRTLEYTPTRIVAYLDGTPVATNTATIGMDYLTLQRNTITKTLGSTSRWIAIDWTYSALYLAADRTFQ